MFTRGIEKKYWLEMIKQTFSHHCIYKTKNYMSNNWKILKRLTHQTVFDDRTLLSAPFWFFFSCFETMRKENMEKENTKINKLLFFMKRVAFWLRLSHPQKSYNRFYQLK